MRGSSRGGGGSPWKYSLCKFNEKRPWTIPTEKFPGSVHELMGIGGFSRKTTIVAYKIGKYRNVQYFHFSLQYGGMRHLSIY